MSAPSHGPRGVTAPLPSRRTVILGALAATLPLRPELLRADSARHAIAMHGAPAWPPDFRAATYVNPAAPKGGRLKSPSDPGPVGPYSSQTMLNADCVAPLQNYDLQYPRYARNSLGGS